MGLDGHDIEAFDQHRDRHRELVEAVLVGGAPARQRLMNMRLPPLAKPSTLRPLLPPLVIQIESESLENSRLAAATSVG